MLTTNYLLTNNTLYIYIYIGLVGRVLANGPGDMDSITGHVYTKDFKNGT